MNDLLLRGYIGFTDMASRMLEKGKKIRKDESGMEVIAIVIIVAIVVALGLLFWDAIQKFFTSLWEQVAGSGDAAVKKIGAGG
jgi:hypothetical protein